MLQLCVVEKLAQVPLIGKKKTGAGKRPHLCSSSLPSSLEFNDTQSL